MKSEIPPFNRIVAWAEELAAMEPLEPTLYTPLECEVFLGSWIGACREASRLLTNLGSRAEPFVEVSAYSLMEVVWREDVSVNLCEEAVTLSPRMIKALCEQRGPSVVTGSFWMVIVRCWRANHRSYAGHRLLPTVKSTLLDQVRTSGEIECLRDSAWAGVKLIDEQVGAEARAIEDARK
jgi:hypothetical protein